jgi:hypothetical protein
MWHLKIGERAAWKLLINFLCSAVDPGLVDGGIVKQLSYVYKKTKYVLDQDQQLSEDEELPLGVEAAINEDGFDLEDLGEDEEFNADRIASQASLASSTFLSAIQEVG